MLFWYFAVASLAASASGACTQVVSINDVQTTTDPSYLEKFSLEIKQKDPTHIVASFNVNISKSISGNATIKVNVVGTTIPYNQVDLLEKYLKEDKMMVEPAMKCSSLTRDYPVKEGPMEGKECEADLSMVKNMVSKKATATIQIISDKGEVILKFVAVIKKECKK